MKEREMIRVDPIMKFYIESETKKLAEQIKKRHNLKSLKIPFITGSQWLGNVLMGKKSLIKYRVRKISLNEGILEFL
jgi:hypothetical protein